MEIKERYVFPLGFYDDISQIKVFVKDCHKAINLKANDLDKNEETNNKITILEVISKKISNKDCLDYVRISQGNLLHFLGERTESIELLQKALDKTSIDQNNLNASFKTAFLFIRGKICLHLYAVKFNNGHLDNTKLENYGDLFEAKKHFSILLNMYLSDKSIANSVNIGTALLHYCMILGHLSRYVESFSLLDELGLKHTDLKENIALARFLMLQKIAENTCDTTNPFMLIRLEELLDISIESPNLYKRNHLLLEETRKDIETKLEKCMLLNNVTKEELKLFSHQAKIESEKYNHHQKFIQNNHLTLNEHSLYCECKDAIIDNLTINSACEHTKTEKTEKYQLLIKKIILDFDNARKTYFRATEKASSSSLYKTSTKSQIDKGNVLMTPETNELISSFSKCFSILDKIASGVNSVFEIETDIKKKKKIFFNSFFRRNDVKRIINREPNNLFLIAMYSISQDLDKANRFSDFSQYKDWRNAIEHDQFYLVSDDANIEELHKASIHEDVDFFVHETEFRNKTMYMLQLCKSAIFTFTWLIRKASIQWAKNELPGN